jgi:excisionase family DNA binding protein
VTEEIPDNRRDDKRMPPLLSLDQAANVLGVVRQYAHRMAVSKELPGQQVGKTWVFRTAVVLKVREEREAKKNAPPA